MTRRIHAAAGLIALFTILAFWSSTLISEVFGGPEIIAAVKTRILYGMLILIPALLTAAATGARLGRGRMDSRIQTKKRRMPFIAANGLLILLPSALYLAGKAAAGGFDTSFYAVQALELFAGAANASLIGLNMRDGLRLSRRIGG